MPMITTVTSTGTSVMISAGNGNGATRSPDRERAGFQLTPVLARTARSQNRNSFPGTLLLIH